MTKYGIQLVICAYERVVSLLNGYLLSDQCRLLFIHFILLGCLLVNGSDTLSLVMGQAQYTSTIYPSNLNKKLKKVRVIPIAASVLQVVFNIFNGSRKNFNLFRLESTYEIREDIQEAVPHLLAHTNNQGQHAFRGWSRIVVPIQEFKITEVKQPNIAEVKPSSVTAEVTFSISSYREQIRSEWNALKEHMCYFCFVYVHLLNH
ncbi:intron-binding protein aquarius [Artemisia annua]|uniref:Intron-binding protein aquarius n=1 Tax=Artemisia annua TaxID=35608 RepID=A0A2U1P548_ARTAN|nr:intron-binding protein aquarius [Artemisia annua]